jgi:hypothetical protein
MIRFFFNYFIILLTTLYYIILLVRPVKQKKVYIKFYVFI